MSLAATRGNYGSRPASSLPAIKCSNCGEEIEIASMGEHICGSAPPTTARHAPNTSNPFTLRQLNATGQRPSFAPSPLQLTDSAPASRSGAPVLSPAQYGSPKPSRMPPPKINAEAANRPFLTPRAPGFDAPLSPAVSIRSASSVGTKPGLLRSFTTPMPRPFERPPSPELSANLDCAFPPFPVAPFSKPAGRRPSTSSGRKTPTGSERAPSRGGSRLDHVMTAEPEPFNLEPMSPRSNGGENVLKRMNTLRDGLFNANRRKGSNESAVPESITRPTTANSNYSLPRRPSVPAAILYPQAMKQTEKVAPPRPTRPLEPLSPSFLGQFSAEPESDSAASSSAPVPSGTFTNGDKSVNDQTHSRQLSSMRSAPDLRHGDRRPSLRNAPVSEPSKIPMSQAVRPRSSSKSGNRVDYRLDDAPPVPQPAERYRQDSIHAPSESASSDASIQNSLGNGSTGPSPTESAASSIEAFSPLSYDSARYGGEAGLRIGGLQPAAQRDAASRVEQRKPASPPENFAGPTPPEDRRHESGDAPMTPLESPMDPALLNRSVYVAHNQSRPAPLNVRSATLPTPAMEPARSAPNEFFGNYDPFRPTPAPTASRAPANAADVPIYTPRSGSTDAGDFQFSVQPPPVPQDARPTRKPTRRGTMTKHSCRGCGQVIEGKSVKAADGRLTGRWHKACFVCRTCTQPFTTADFYVIENEPYCEQHYHEQNGSLCHGCHRGIEGQYLETTSSTRIGTVDKKFHPRCFTCCECRQVLADDYFEISNLVYCELHALAAMRAQARLAGPGLNPPNFRGVMAERRTTKLMNMS